MNKKFDIQFARAISEFERAIKTFRVKRILYKNVFRGKGLEFDSYRDFGFDDDASDIDWKSSLRANKLLVKKYIEERDLDIYFVLDVSNSMMFGSGKKLKLEYAAEVIAAISNLAINSNNKISLIMFTDHLVSVMPPTSAKKDFYFMMDNLSNPEFYGGGFEFPLIVDYLLKVIESPFSVVFLISDFIHFRKGFSKLLRLLAVKFETIAIMIRDVFDNELPRDFGQLVLKDPYSNRQIVVDSKIAAGRYNQIALKQKLLVKQLFEKSNIDFLELKTNKSFVVPLVSFLKGRVGGK